MTLNQFVNTWNGKHLESSGNKPGQGGYNQCVDVAIQWAKNLGKKYFTGNAISWAGYLPGYQWVPNTLWNVPTAGSLIVWKATKSNYYCGHIGLYLSGNVMSFTSFDQNYPTGSACHKQWHNYSNVAGWQKPL